MLSVARRKPRRTKSYSILEIVSVVALLLLIACFRGFYSFASVVPPTRNNKMPPFSLIVKLNFSSDIHKQVFLKDIAPLCEYVKSHEATTIAYEVLLSDKDPLKVVILERYVDKDEAFLKVHRNSKPFLEFRPKLKAMQDAGAVIVEGESYVDSGVGFVGGRAAQNLNEEKDADFSKKRRKRRATYSIFIHMEGIRNNSPVLLLSALFQNFGTASAL